MHHVHHNGRRGRQRRWLLNGVAIIAVAAVAAAGLVAAPSAVAAVSAVTPAAAGTTAAAAAGVPVAPFVTDVVAVGLGATVSWNPSPTIEQVTGYAVTATPKTTIPLNGCTPVAQTVQVGPSDSQTVVAGLCAQILYVVKMTASNAAGTSVFTPAWTPVAPLVAQVPTAPAVTFVTPRDRQALVAWAAPVDTGGLPVTGYTLTATRKAAAAGTAPTTTVQAAPDTRSATLGGLANGSAYLINIVATSTVGASPAGTITTTPKPAYAPTAPTGLTTTPNGTGGGAAAGTVAVSWAAPTDNGGAPVTGYTLTWQQATYTSKTTGGVWKPATGSTVHTQTVAPNTDPATPDGAVSFTVPAAGFEQATAAYLFAVAATNSAGTGTKAATFTGVSPTVGIKTTTVVLTIASLAALSGATATTLTWTNPAPTQITTLKAGQTLVADTTSALTPSGFLRTITTITGQNRSTGNTVLTTTNATLPDTFTNTSVATTVNPLADSTTAGASSTPSTTPTGPVPARPRFVPAMPGVTVLDDPISATGNPDAAGPGAGGTEGPGAQAGGIGGGFTISPSITMSVDVATGPLKVAGSVTVTPTVGFELNLTTGAFGIPNGLRVSQTARIAAQTQMTTSLHGEHKFKIGELPGVPVPLGPVVILPSIPIYLVVSGDAAITTTTGMAIGAQLGWDSRNPTVLSYNNLSTAPTLTGAPDPGSVTFSGSVGLAVEPALRIYGVAGPYIGAELNLKAEFTPAPAPGQPWLKIAPELVFKLGLKLDLFGTNADLTYTAPPKTFTPFLIAAAPTAAYTVTPTNPAVAPGKTVQLQATRTVGGTAIRTWTLTGGTTKDKISTTGLFTAGTTTGRTLTATVRDTTGATGRVTITIGTPFDPPGNTTATANIDAQGNNTAAITWTPPTNTGGKPLTGYTVLTTPDTGTHTVPATTTTMTIPGIGAGAYVNIYATNTAGTRSRAATTSVHAASRAAAVATGMAAGIYSTCALIVGGAVRCWGDNSVGQLGDGTTGDKDHRRLTPVTVTGLGAAIAIAAPQNGTHACALLSNRTVRCWGAAEGGALGDGTTGDRNGNRLTPVSVAGISTATAITAGGSHSCALLADRTVRCWGDDTYGQLGDGTAGEGNRRLTPVAVEGVTTATAIAASSSHTCALLADHTIRCWGYGRFGELGDGSDNNALTPVAVQGITTATAVATGSGHTCALLADRTLRCWGSDFDGQLGDGTRGDGNQRRLTPVTVQGITAATAITAGQSHTCALLVDRTTRCWGNDVLGSLGEGTPDNDEEIRLTPVTPIGVQNVTVLVSGAAHTCAIADNGTVSCWGYDQQGQLGDGTTGDPFYNYSRRSAVAVIGL